MASEYPQLIIVGGPNGAGKSTYSGGLSPVGAVVFDADIIAARVATRFPSEIPVESIQLAVQSVFLDFVEEAIRNKQHFTIETNFRDHQLMDTVARFKESGYSATMIYMTLNNVELSIDRVKQRVISGGHFVDETSIRYNFEEGLNNLEYFSDRFDSLQIIDASDTHGKVNLLLSITNHQLIYLADTLHPAVKNTIINIADRSKNNPQNDNEPGWDFSLDR